MGIRRLSMKLKMMRMSISKKTILLLFLFVLLPSVLAGSILIFASYRRNEETACRLVLQKLENHCQRTQVFLNTIRKMGNDFAEASLAKDILLRGKESESYYEYSRMISNTLRYDDHIQKVQLIKEGKVIWNYGVDAWLIFDNTGNEEYARQIEEENVFSLWSPVHPMFALEKGRFSDRHWMTTYYRAVVDTESMSTLGVLAIQIEEEDYSELLRDISEGSGAEVWLLNSDGGIMACTDKSFYEKGLPENIKDSFLNGTEAEWVHLDYNGYPSTLYCRKCGEFDIYILQLNKRENMRQDIFLFVLEINSLFLLFCVVYLLLYRKLVIHPLESLSRRVEGARRLADEKKENQISFQRAADLQSRKNDRIPEKSKMSEGGDEILLLTDHFREMLGEIDSLINNVYVERIKTQQAEQEALLSQINPHFLYNTLDSIHWNALKNKDRETGEQLEALSSMLRETLNFGNKHTTVEKELSIIDNYCFLLEARFHKEIRFDIQADPAAQGIKIPKLILQPLIENAYKHGLEKKLGDKRILVKVRLIKRESPYQVRSPGNMKDQTPYKTVTSKTEGWLVFYVADNGVGCRREEILRKMKEEGKECFALKNIRDRLSLECGRKADLHFWSREGTGTIVRLMIPLKETGD